MESRDSVIRLMWTLAMDDLPFLFGNIDISNALHFTRAAPYDERQRHFKQMKLFKKVYTSEVLNLHIHLHLSAMPITACTGSMYNELPSRSPRSSSGSVLEVP